MGKFWKWFRMILIVAPRLLFSFWFFFSRYGRHPEKYPLELRYRRVRNFFVFALKHMRINLQVKGLERLNDGQRKIVVGNHSGFIEALMLIALSKDPIALLSKKENEKVPFIGKMLKAIGCVFIDRKDPLATLRQFRALAKKIKEENLTFVIFPEGTRNRNPEETDLLPFHNGSLRLALDSESPIVTLVQFGCHRPMEGKKNYRSYPVTMEFLEPMPYESFAGSKTKQLEEPIIEKMVETLHRLKEEDKASRWWTYPEIKAILPSK